MIATDGVWTPADRHAYFLAGDGRPSRTGDPHKFILMAVNEIIDGQSRVKDKQRDRIEHLLNSGVRLFIDSGVFWLTNNHMRAHGITMDEALALPPSEVDGFDWLWNGYLEVHRLFGDRAWGFIELDQGGAENKRKTRAKLNDLGIHPMPVYHPFNDGWDYFDEIAETHDRMCCGNVVQAPRPVRVRLLHTIAERHRAYPDLWVHFLGYTPSEWVNAVPVDSCDSSTWLSSVRWAPPRDAAMHKAFRQLPRGFMYRLGSDENSEMGSAKATRLSACTVVFQARSWAHYQARQDEVLGMPTYPPYTDAETDEDSES